MPSWKIYYKSDVSGATRVVIKNKVNMESFIVRDSGRRGRFVVGYVFCLVFISFTSLKNFLKTKVLIGDLVINELANLYLYSQEFTELFH